MRLPPSSTTSWHGWSIFWYLVLGLVHELIHWSVALVLLQSNTSWGVTTNTQVPTTENYEGFFASFDAVDFWYQLLIGRKLTLNIFGCGGNGNTSYPNNDSIHANVDTHNSCLVVTTVIRQAGWIASFFLALWIEQQFQTNKPTNNKKHDEVEQRFDSPLRWAAWVTAAEAIWTDLLQWPLIPGILSEPGGATAAKHAVQFCCGNFGMLLLHYSWWTHETGGGQSALDILEKLIQVTMMRGAQAGGVVCFHPSGAGRGGWTTTTNSSKTSSTNIAEGNQTTNYFLDFSRRSRNDSTKNGGTLHIDDTSTCRNGEDRQNLTNEALEVNEGHDQAIDESHKSGSSDTNTNTCKGSPGPAAALPQLRGIRSRIVNQKRTDLSVLLRQKVARQNNFSTSNSTCSCIFQGNNKASGLFPKDFVPVLIGHTRFATSSKATIADTHPHQWTPPSPRRVYNMDQKRQQKPSFSQGLEAPGASRGREGSEVSPTVMGEIPTTRDPSTSSLSSSSFCEPQVVMVENYVTHNGDFDFYRVHRQSYDLGQIQSWLERVLNYPKPAEVDSCAVAGMIDLLRTQGCFGLSARHAVCLSLPKSHLALFGSNAGCRKKTENTEQTKKHHFPPYSHFEAIGMPFEVALQEMLNSVRFSDLEKSEGLRNALAWRVARKLENRRGEFFGFSSGLSGFVDDTEGGSSLFTFCAATIKAFFDNDLFAATQIFMANASGSFGLCVTSSLDAHRQLCLAARGQTMCVALYPCKGVILYGSEQAAVKAGLGVPFPGNPDSDLDQSSRDVDNDALRYDLDDLGGEIMLLDFDRNRLEGISPVSMPYRHLTHHKLMNGKVIAVIHQESRVTTKTDPEIYHRMIRLSRNRFVKPLPEYHGCKDLIRIDIEDIPKVCSNIQDDWHSDYAATSLNRLTAHTLSRALRRLLDKRIKGETERSSRAVDILLTGCEVSLWLAEQFASDLQKAFPKLDVVALSSNKLLGLYGQDVPVPAFGFPHSPRTMDLHDAIVIIVSHSGGSFAPLACSNLLQSSTKNIFAVTSETDTQIGKQLAAMDATENVQEQGIEQLFLSRIFSTEVGIRPAEPCSVSVVATHQLLTNLFMYISVIIIIDMRYRQATGATICEQDLQILERCNRENLDALSEIVGVTKDGLRINEDDSRQIVESELRKAGDLWADHILENTRAYIMTFVYIFVTVISGYPLAYAIAYGAGWENSNNWIYAINTIDAALFFWMPQINIFLLRLFQRRNLLHRMVGRTVVIGDIPWVSQCAEAFLSKIFAVSYSIAGLTVMNGNPADHLVHRQTHRIVRGSLLICGRPDGRLSALTSAEAAVCLSVNQASSIQSLGGTCESLTIGHNPFKLPLSAKAIFLKRRRPLFLCERVLLESDFAKEELSPDHQPCEYVDPLCLSRDRDASIELRRIHDRSAIELLGSFRNHDKNADNDTIEDNKNLTDWSLEILIATANDERKWSDRARNLFKAFDKDEDGVLSEEEYIAGWNEHHTKELTTEELMHLFRVADKDGSGKLDYEEFHDLLENNPSLSIDAIKIPPSLRDRRGLIQIEPSTEKYFGELLRKYNDGKVRDGGKVDFSVARRQENAMDLYESRIGSLQRFVCMIVMFHQMGHRVERFFEKISFGFLAYRMDRTHSIMRIATTASPVSGADIRHQMYQLRLMKRVKLSIRMISSAWLRYKEKKNVRELVRRLSSYGDMSSSGNFSLPGSVEEDKERNKRVLERGTSSNSDATMGRRLSSTVAATVIKELDLEHEELSSVEDEERKLERNEKFLEDTEEATMECDGENITTLDESKES
ncbi:hypothetical protein ACA910_009847 [Epithemia clementina (nom. ined.)]